MILQFYNGTSVSNPKPGFIRQCVADLGADEFLILTAGQERYLQTYLNPDGTFQLEYRDGDYDRHFAAVDTTLPAERISETFENYAAENSVWRDSLEWEKVDFEEDFEGDAAAEDAYEIGHELLAKIPVGSETRPSDGTDQKCAVCGSVTGSFHATGCGLEECPKCHDKITVCGCL